MFFSGGPCSIGCQFTLLYTTKAGSSGCDSEDYTSDMCIQCKDKATQVNTEHLVRIINKIQDKLFPNMNETESAMEIDEK